jgi:hypothetical protein
MQNINLFDRRLLPPPPDWLGIGLGVAAVVALVASLSHLSVEKVRLARALAAAVPTATETAAPVDDQALRSLGERVARRTALRDALQRAGGGADSLGRVVESVAQALPPEAWLTEVVVGSDRSLRVGGGALDVAALAPFAQRLQQVDALRGLALNIVSVEKVRLEAEAAGTPMASAGDAAPKAAEGAEATEAARPEAAPAAATDAPRPARMVHRFTIAAGVAATEAAP